MGKFGHYSKNERLDPASLKEPENDTEYSRKLWFEDMPRDPDFTTAIHQKIANHKKKAQEVMNPEKLVIHTVGESHIDCAWLWRYEQTRQKAALTFQKACRHAKMFPGDFNFALSEPMLLEWVKEDNPTLFKEIQDTVKNGGIELVGGAYVEPDCMMPSGEAFVRQRLYGMRFYRDNFNILPNVEWFLDSFGYNWNLPQILTKSGAKYFWTTKITWNAITRFPFVNFWWEGPDSSRILTANFPMGLGSVDRLPLMHTGHRPLKKDGKKVWNYEDDYSLLENHVEPHEICPHVGNFFGKGDGGHGPTHQEVAEAKAMIKEGFGKWSRVEQFYQELEHWADRFPIWRDELYLEYHQGTFSVHAEIKRHNRKYENALTSLESLALLAVLTGAKYAYPHDLLEKMWKVVLKNQFHDVLPGSSIPEVYDDCWDDWMWLDATIAEKERAIGQSIVQVVNSTPHKNSDSKSMDLLLFNPVAWDRKSPVFIPLSVFASSPPLNSDGKPNYATLQYANSPGKEILCQPIAREPAETIEQMPAGWWVVIELKGLCTTRVKLSILSDENHQKVVSHGSTPFTSSSTTLSNGIITLQLDAKSGALVALQSSQINGGSNLLRGNDSNLSFGFKDISKQYPAWNLTPNYWNYPLILSNTKDVKISISELGPVFATMQITRKLGKSPVTQKLTLFEGDPTIYLEYLADWAQRHAMIKVLYQTATNAEDVIADTAYAAISRKTNPKSPCDKARYEKIMHKYADLSTPDHKWGIALINEGKYAFDTNGGDIRLTMLRSPTYPHPAGESWAYPERAKNLVNHFHSVPRFSGMWEFKCRYALLPHLGGTLIDEKGNPSCIVKRRAEEFNQPVSVIPAPGICEGTSTILGIDSPLLQVKTPNVYLGALKFNEWEKTGNIITRFVEGSGLPTNAEIQFSSLMVSKIGQIRSTDLLERPNSEELHWDGINGKLIFPLKKFEIRTIEILLKK